MKKWKGTSLAPGFADGSAFIYTPTNLGEVQRRDIGNAGIGREIQRFEHAIFLAEKELDALKSRVAHELGESEAAIFNAHIMMMKDSSFVQRIREGITTGCCNAEYAVHAEIAAVIELFKTSETLYLRERTQDMADIETRLLGQLEAPGHRGSLQLGRIPPNTVVVAKDLLPSDTFALNRDNVVAIITEIGGSTSHATILCRALGIPKVTGILGATEIIQNGARVLVDADHATVTLSPTSDVLTRFANDHRRYTQQCLTLRREEALNCITKDGIRMYLYANLGKPEEMEMAPAQHVDGVGLFRTEYLFLQSSRRPSMEQHYSAYCNAARKMGGKPLIIRTMDFGGDKYPSFFLQASGSQQVEFQRGLLFSLKEGHMLRTQLRAIIRAFQEYPKIEVMFPMVLDGEELQRAICLLQRLAESEGAKQIPLVGAMIETPSAVFEIESILDHADFVSIGTNDLTQFVLAGDRELPSSLAYADVLHPAMLKAIRLVIQAANRRERRVSVCGEVAGEPALACLLAGMGLRHLSLNMAQVASVAHYLRTMSLVDLERVTRTASEAKNVQGVKDVIQTIHREVKRARA